MTALGWAKLVLGHDAPRLAFIAVACQPGFFRARQSQSNSAPLTNRTLYLSATKALTRNESSERELADYLRCLAHLLAARCQDGTVGQEDFVAALEAAFHTEVPAPGPVPTTEPWLQLLQRQVIDLAQLERDGRLSDPMRSFGIDAAKGGRWYNFTPHSFVECALVGAFGGWEDGDEGDRVLVRGPVAVMGEDGEVTTVNPEDLESDVEPLERLDAEALEDFFICGQTYE